MIKTIKLIIMSSVLISFFSQAEIKKEFYNEIENTFIEHALSKNKNAIKIKANDFRKITDEEIANIEKIEKENSELKDIFLKIKNNEWSNNDIVYTDDKNILLLYPEKLKPENFRNNYCHYMIIYSDLNSCISNYILVNANIKEVSNDSGLFLDDNYLSDFTYIHELAHLLPEQKNIPDFNFYNVYIDNITMHYSEIYSDLFALIFLHNYLGYKEDKIEDIIMLRNMKLFSHNDLMHYSVPYIKELLINEEWKKLNSFEDISRKISSVYKFVNDNNIISKKSHKDILKEYTDFCNSFNVANVSTRNTIDIIMEFCKNKSK